MSVTTSLGMNEALVAQAKEIAANLGLVYVERNKRSIGRLLADWEGVFVVYKDRLVLERRQEEPLFFHPDTAILRLKAERDPLLQLVGPGPKKVLDGTLGLGSDSIVLAASGHEVTGLESSKWIAYIVSRGLRSYKTGQADLDRRLASIRVIQQDSLSFLRQQEDAAFDVVYFDPMFSEEIVESANLRGLHGLADTSRLTADLLAEAQRVAREKIIIKAHFRDRVFEEFGFTRHVRPNQKFHYGEMKGEEFK